MSRENYTEALIRTNPVTNAVELLQNIRVSVYAAGTTTLQTIYADRTSGTQITNPIITAADGLVTFWGNAGDYDLKFEDTQTPARIATTTYGWSSTPGASNSIPGTFITNDSLTTTQIVEASIAAALGAALVPSGAIMAFGGVAAPSGFLLCDGSAVSRSTYSALFSAIGLTHGSGDGSTTFNVPDIKGRSPMGAGAGSGLTTRTAGNKLGGETHVITTGEMPSHTHTVTDSGHSHTYTDPGHNHAELVDNGAGALANVIALAHTRAGLSDPGYSSNHTTGITINSGTTGITVAANGSGTPATILHPVTIVTYIIKT